MKTKKNGAKSNENEGGKKKASKERKNSRYIAEGSSKKKTVKKKNSLFKIIKDYFNGVIYEARHVKWTNMKDLVKYSFCTLVFVVFFGIYFYAIDWIVLLIRSLAQ